MVEKSQFFWGKKGKKLWLKNPNSFGGKNKRRKLQVMMMQLVHPNHFEIPFFGHKSTQKSGVGGAVVSTYYDKNLAIFLPT